MKRKGYPEGLEQLENNPELAGIEVNYSKADDISSGLRFLTLKKLNLY